MAKEKKPAATPARQQAIVGERIVLQLATEGDGWTGRITQQIKSWAAAGMGEKEIIANLSSELKSGGGLFESMMKGFKNATGQAVDYVSVEQVHEEWKGEDLWIWITRRDKSVCHDKETDCEFRESVSMTWAEWEAMGLPGLGTTTCDWRCRCVLRPDIERMGNKPPW